MTRESHTTGPVTLDSNLNLVIIPAEPGRDRERRHCEPAGLAVFREAAERHPAGDAPLSRIRVPFMPAHHVQPGQAGLGQGKPQV
jgi:hypothetical protein